MSSVSSSSSGGEHTGQSAEPLWPLREALCWDWLHAGCARGDACTKLHLRSRPCRRHCTHALSLWGKRVRPECSSDCGQPHPTTDQLLRLVESATDERGLRLHVEPIHRPALLDEPTESPTSRRYFLVARDLSAADASSLIRARSPQPLCVAVDCAYDDMMDHAERRSLVTQATPRPTARRVEARRRAQATIAHECVARVPRSSLTATRWWGDLSTGTRSRSPSAPCAVPRERSRRCERTDQTVRGRAVLRRGQRDRLPRRRRRSAQARASARCRSSSPTASRAGACRGRPAAPRAWRASGRPGAGRPGSEWPGAGRPARLATREPACLPKGGQAAA